MASPRFSINIPLSRLLAVLALAVVPLSIVGLFTVWQADSAMREAVGLNFQTLASSQANRVSQSVHDKVVQVAMLAQTPSVVDAVTSANQTWQGVPDDGFEKRIAAIEQAWNTRPPEPLLSGILTSKLARAFQDVLHLDRRFLRITLTDQRGAVVAASHKTLDYYQADEDFWQSIYAQGRGSVNLTEVLYDEVTKSSYIGIGVPVLDDTGRFLGALDVLLDVSTILPAATPESGGVSTKTMLVKDDGTIISSPDTNLAMNVKAPEFGGVLDALANRPARSGSIVTRAADGREVVLGFADTGLRRDYRNLGWFALTTQDSRQAYAPVRGAIRLIFVLAMFGLAAIVILTAIFATHRELPYQDLADVVVDRAPRASMAGKAAGD